MQPHLETLHFVQLLCLSQRPIKTGIIVFGCRPHDQFHYLFTIRLTLCWVPRYHAAQCHNSDNISLIKEEEEKNPFTSNVVRLTDHFFFTVTSMNDVPADFANESIWNESIWNSLGWMENFIFDRIDFRCVCVWNVVRPMLAGCPRFTNYFYCFSLIFRYLCKSHFSFTSYTLDFVTTTETTIIIKIIWFRLTAFANNFQHSEFCSQFDTRNFLHRKYSNVCARQYTDKTCMHRVALHIIRIEVLPRTYRNWKTTKQDIK